MDFDSPSATQKAVQTLKASGVQAQMAKQQEQKPTNLHISNLPFSMDEQELKGMLKSFGQVISTRILRDMSGTSRGVGFARMESPQRSVKLSSPTLMENILRHLLEYQPHLIPCFANLLMGVQGNDRTKEILCKMDSLAKECRHAWYGLDL